MYDILHREVKEKDLVVAKGTGRYNNGLNIGIVIGSSIQFRDFKANYSEIYLIENPTKEEIDLKNKILEKLKKEKEEKEKLKERKKLMKPIPKKELALGNIYVTDNDEELIYLGKGSVEESNLRGSYGVKSSGYVFIKTKYKKLEKVNELNFRFCQGIFTRKTLPRFVKRSEQIFDLKGQKNFCFSDEENYGYYKRSIKISLD